MDSDLALIYKSAKAAAPNKDSFLKDNQTEWKKREA